MMSDGADESWSAPDADGVRTRVLDVGAVSTLRGRRLRRTDALALDAASTWPEEWRELARDWLSGSTASARWKTLLGRAGHRRSAFAVELFDALLRAGWIEADERRERGRWQVTQVQFLALEAQREALGLVHRSKRARQREALQAIRFEDPSLQAAADALASMPDALAIRRHGWLAAMQRWQVEQRSGTRRDFALFASGLTKGIADADWRWLAETLPLPEYGVESHTPLLLLRAPIACARVPDFIGLSPATVEAGTGFDGRVPRWRLLENRTSFERAAIHCGDEDGVVWLPGHPPHWWLRCMRRLLQLQPAPGLIACDPDPAGIEIALAAGTVWNEAGLEWSPWEMDAQVLDRLPAHQPLTEFDHQHLQRLLDLPLPPALRDLAMAMLRRNIKGEQEGLRSF